MKRIFALSVVVLLVFTFIGCNQAPEKTITKWEYKIDSIPDVKFEESINKLGSEGWELVFGRRARGIGDEFSYEMIFKRPKLEGAGVR